MARSQADTRRGGIDGNGVTGRAAAGFVRPMEAGDLASVLAIERRSYQYPWSEGIFRDCLRHGYGCFVHDMNGLTGYIVVSCAAKEAHILNVCVAPERRGRGIADRLLEVALERAEVMDAEAVFLEVRPSNPAARRLYERYGFHEIGRRPDYYPAPKGREDALILGLPVVVGHIG